MIKDKLIKALIELFFEIEGFKVDKIEELALKSRRTLITELGKLNEFVNSLAYFIELTLPSDERFIRLNVEDNKDKLLTTNIPVTDWAYKDFPFLKANKKFLNALLWLFEEADKENVELKVVRGFIPWVRPRAFSWLYRKIATHSKGKGADIIIPNSTPAVTLEILRQILSKKDKLPFSLVFIEDLDSVHVNFIPFSAKKRFFSFMDYKYKPCMHSEPNHYLKEIWNAYLTL